MTSEGKLFFSERLALIKTLNRLPDAQFKELVYALDPPPGVIPPPTSPQGDRAPELLRWAENPDVGPGLAKLQEVLSQVLEKELEPLDHSPENNVGNPPPRLGKSPSTSFAEDLRNGVTLEMIHIPEGRFWMGSPENEKGWTESEGPCHRVFVPAFFMSKYPVTQLQWHAVSLLAKVKRELKPDPSRFKEDKRPVESVSWDDAMEFCARLSKHTDKEYRLPSEAEWEYACRAGTTTPFHFGKRFPFRLSLYRRFREETRECGEFPANAFGLYDMHGNVWEWCLDHWHDNYDGAPTDGSAWIEGGDSDRRVLRGFSLNFDPDSCRSATRNRSTRDSRGDNVGFRVICASSWTL